jgi:hypothetical protein
MHATKLRLVSLLRVVGYVQKLGGALFGGLLAPVVAGRGVDLGTPGELLDCAEIGAGIEQVADEHAPQVVRREGRHTGLDGAAAGDVQHALPRHPPAVEESPAFVDRHEQRPRDRADHLDIGRPDQVVLILDRRLTPRTPGRLTTNVVTRGVNPQLFCTYKSCRLKQYFKLGRALRTETVISDTRDFGIGRRVCALNWTALRAVGDSANRRLCDAEMQTAQPAPDVVTLPHVTRPSTATDRLHAPALCFADPRVMALLAALVLFTHAIDGFDNRQLVKSVRRLRHDSYSSRQATYDLRRLRRKALITRLPHSHRYQLTPFGRRVAVLFTKANGRVLAPGLALLDPTLPPDLAKRSPVATAWRQLDHALNHFVDRQLLAA